jgi:hypothetical protein
MAQEDMYWESIPSWLFPTFVIGHPSPNTKNSFPMNTVGKDRGEMPANDGRACPLVPSSPATLLLRHPRK